MLSRLSSQMMQRPPRGFLINSTLSSVFQAGKCDLAFLSRQKAGLPRSITTTSTRNMDRTTSSSTESGTLPSAYDQFVLFGASIIEHSSSQERGFALSPALQQAAVGHGVAVWNNFDFLYLFTEVLPAYIRRMDVVNRGFSGYNTTLALKILPKVLPDPKHAKVKFLVVLFGSNDACFLEADNGQHVPLEEYKTNLAKILTHPSVQAHNPRLILVTPPPVEERRLDERVKSQGYTKLNRSNVITKTYADASREVAKDMDIACLDLWAAFMAKAGWKPGDPLYGSIDLPENDVIRGLIHDGLHFTPEAYKIFYEELLKVIADKWPDQLPQQLPYALPAWDDAPIWAKEGLKMGNADAVRHQ